jgi:hypothetical protein
MHENSVRPLCRIASVGRGEPHPYRLLALRPRYEFAAPSRPTQLWDVDRRRRTTNRPPQLGIRGELPSSPTSLKALRPLRGAQERAALTDASVPGEALS